MGSSQHRKLRRLQAKQANGPVGELARVLSGLTPGLREVESQIKDMAPTLEAANRDVEETLRVLRADMARQHFVQLSLLHRFASGALPPDITFEGLAEMARDLEAQYKEVESTLTESA